MTGRRQTTRKKLKELCALHPNDPIFHRQLARHFLQSGREIRAILQARNAYQILVHEHPEEAKSLIDEFGYDVTSSQNKLVWSEDYSLIAKTIGILKQKIRKIRLPEGAKLFKKGDVADHLYLILEGELAVSNENIHNPSLLNFLKAGSLLGEGAFNKQETRNATVVATTDSVLLRLTKQEVHQAFLKHPSLHLQFSKESLLRQRVAALTVSPVFSCLTTDLRFVVAKRAWDMTHTAGKTIKPAHKHMSNVELIRQGKIHLYEETAGSQHYCGRLGEGSLLGLHKIIDGKSSQLTYVAKHNCQVICMDFTIIEDLMDVSDRFRERIRDEAASFSTQTARIMNLQEAS